MEVFSSLNDELKIGFKEINKEIHKNKIDLQKINEDLNRNIISLNRADIDLLDENECEKIFQIFRDD